MSTTTRDDAATALAAMDESRARLAAAADCPPIRHWMFAGIIGGLTATPALTPTLALAAEAALLVCIALVVRWDRRRTGMFINGYRAGKTRPVVFAMLAMVFTLYALGAWLSRAKGVWWAPLPLGVVAALGGYAFSKLWARVFRREMGLGA